MSTNELLIKKQDHSTKAAHSRMSASDADELKQIDAAVQRITNSISEYPYIVSVPCVEPRYHYPSQQEAESWARNTPFRLSEERLQYMTYVYREPNDGCFVVRSHIDEERDRLAQTKKNGITSRPITPVGNNPTKKKISLSAYKSKLAAGILAAKETSPEKEQANSAEKRQMKDVDWVKKAAAPGLVVTPEKKREEKPAQSLKRVRAPEAEKAAKDSLAPPVKKLRLSPPHTLKPSPLLHPNDADSAPHGLPALLSPTNPFEVPSDRPRTSLKKSSSNPWDLPPMLSPTLPAKIEAELARENKRDRADSNISSSSADKSVRTPVSSAPTSASKVRTAEKITIPKFKTPTEDELIKSSQISLVSKAAAGMVLDERQKMVRIDSSTVKPQEERLVIKLQYGRQNTKRVRKILFYPPNPGPDWLKSWAQLEKEDPTGLRDHVTVAPLRKDRPLQSDKASVGAAKQILEKRSLAEDATPAPAAKKIKGPAAIEIERNPRTPIQSAIPSPTVLKSGGSMKSANVSTPGAGYIKSAAMARSQSNDTPVTTPGGGKNSLSTPIASQSRANSSKDKGPTSAPVSAAKSAEIQAINQLSQHYNQLGRKLKHENQAIASKPKDTQTEPEKKRAALLGMECILAYMLAYALGDCRRKLEGRSAEIETSWRTLLPLFKYMRQFARHYAPLEGLHNYLGIAINARISIVATDRLARVSSGPVAADSPQSTAEPVNETRNITVEAFRAMMDCSRDAASALPIEMIMNSFPTTWTTRATGARDAGFETLVNGKGEASLKGRFWLPVGVDTKPVEAVRFGVALIKEWIFNEELGYEPRIRL